MCILADTGHCTCDHSYHNKKSEVATLQGHQESQRSCIHFYYNNCHKFSYWVLLEALGTKRYISNLPLHIGHSLLITSFLSLLFVPKVLPPLWRNVKTLLVYSYQ